MTREEREEFEVNKKRQHDHAEQIAKTFDGYDLREARTILSLAEAMIANRAVVTFRCE